VSHCCSQPSGVERGFRAKAQEAVDQRIHKEVKPEPCGSRLGASWLLSGPVLTRLVDGSLRHGQELEFSPRLSQWVPQAAFSIHYFCYFLYQTLKKALSPPHFIIEVAKLS